MWGFNQLTWLGGYICGWSLLGPGGQSRARADEDSLPFFPGAKPPLHLTNCRNSRKQRRHGYFPNFFCSPCSLSFPSCEKNSFPRLLRIREKDYLNNDIFRFFFQAPGHHPPPPPGPHPPPGGGPPGPPGGPPGSSSSSGGGPPGGGPGGGGGAPFKINIAESIERIREEFNFLQAQYHKWVYHKPVKIKAFKKEKYHNLCETGCWLCCCWKTVLFSLAQPEAGVREAGERENRDPATLRHGKPGLFNRNNLAYCLATLSACPS